MLVTVPARRGGRREPSELAGSEEHKVLENDYFTAISWRSQEKRVFDRGEDLVTS